MVTKRALKTFKRPPSLSEDMDGEERAERVMESQEGIMNMRAQNGRLSKTHERLGMENYWAVEMVREVSKKLHQYGNNDRNDEIMYEDSRAMMIDSLEKLTTPCPFTKQDMYGRDEEIKMIKEQLLTGNPMSCTIIGGEAGMGKTMLAQCVFDDTEVCNRFEVRGWINCHDFESFSTISSVFEKVMHDLMRLRHERCKSSLVVFDGLRRELIADTVNAAFKDAIDNMYNPYGPKWVRFIITTNISRSEASDLMNTIITIVQLEGLTPDESLAMFESVVFSSDSELSKDERSRVLDSEIVPKILSKCANIPCVIKTLALILSTKTSLDEWTHFLDVVWSSVMDPLNMITSTFNLVAFKRLSFLMKRCLLYCSLFPKDYEFDRVDLNIWLAREVKFEKMFKTVDVELIGDIYLQKLSQIGYFVEHGKDEDGHSTYKMPDFSYEFVKSMAKLDYSEYQSVGVGTFNVDPTTIRHVSLIVDDASWHLPPWLHEAKRLQSILFLGKHCQCLTSVEDLIPSLKYLQILSGHVEISERLLRNIGNLELLRSLRLRPKNPKLLVEIITRMQNLKLLDLQHLENIYVLPKEFHKLQFLRHLFVRFNLNDQVIPNNGELLSLTKFNVFITGQDNELHTLIDYGYIVENQEIDHEERNEALNDDTKFSNIALCWESPCHRDDDIVVKALEARTSLKNMTIRCWKGLTVPRFLGLVSLQIMDCHECRLLPSFSTLPELKSFKLWNLDALEYIENVDYHEDEPYFKSLETLILGNLPKVKAWKEHDKFKNKLIRQLTKLQISNSKLESLPLLMEKIVSLEVKDISVELLKSLINSKNTSTPTVIAFGGTTPMLKTLNISVV